MNNAIVVEHLTKKFNKKTVIKDLSFKVPHGTIFTFLGPNGAGKSTTIKTIMNILSPDQGRIKVLGADSLKLSPKELLQIGYVSENQDILEWMTAEQFFNYCKDMYPLWDDAFVSKLVQQFDISLTEKLKYCSRGMKMKVSLVSSLAYRPKLLILDEPFNGLDPVVRDELIDGILEITVSQNWTIFLSSHNIDEVEKLADIVAILDKGEIKIEEQIESLQQRFKRIEINLSEKSVENISYSESFLFPEQKGRMITFVDSSYERNVTENKIYESIPSVSNITVKGLSLKEIFLVLARHYKINNI